MSSGSEPQHQSSMAALPVGRATRPLSAAERRARYFNSANAFNISLPEVPAGIFSEPIAQALQDDAATGYVDCDQSAALATPYPATTPFMLARYARINAGETLEADFAASGSIWYVMHGSMQVVKLDGEADQLVFTGDVLYLPAGAHVVVNTGDVACVAWLVTDEPMLAHHGLRAVSATSSDRDAGAVLFRAEDIAAQIETIYRTVPDAGTSGMAVVFSAQAYETSRNLMPNLTLSLNTLPAHCHQSPHRHNSAALTLVVAADRCYSRVDEQQCPWTAGATLVTPAGAPHSHHNEGDTRAAFLIVQDGGLYYQARTMGFEFLEKQAD
ncbi:cupin domain-containing protein [Bordetella genomosp. 4]|uniref:cupin domain-containing protein n=1 Tax=Bordetella genomosp. 4 TaxID=463044 RepID=UPI000B9E0F11|nr:cupin domain-containing protein [Bordetella genomosp. 4]OZI42937.1 hypothetical protein CAL21_19145 [Bordetella genomosp. 4]